MPRKKAPPPKKTPKVLTPEILGKDEEELSSDEKDTDESPEELDSEEGVIELSGDDSADDSVDVIEEKSGLPATLDRQLRAVSASDPLRRYMDELKQYPLLDPEQEIELVSRMQEKGDMDAARRLVQANLRLVVKIAFEYRSVYANMMDLIQEGNVGLMKAVSKYDATKGARVGYYASWWIRSYILKYLLDNFRLVKVGTTQAQKKLFFHLMREKEKLEAQGLLAGPKLLAEKLAVREKDVIEMESRLSSSGSELSLDSPMKPGDENRGSFVEMLQDEKESADEKLARQEMLSILETKLPEFRKSLNEKEQKVLQERLLAEEPKTLQEVANLYGLTRERARQIEAKVVQKLRDFLQDELR